MYHRSRIPSSCPAGFQGRYTVQPRDTFFFLSQMFRTTIQSLVMANPHIPNPNQLFPGDVLCVPGFIAFPCCVQLKPLTPLPFGSGASVSINFAPRGGQSISFMATLPHPSVFGNFDAYLGEVSIPEIGGYGNQLIPIPDDPPLWSIRIDLPTAVSLVLTSVVYIRTYNTTTTQDGPILFSASLTNCCNLL